MHQLGVNGREPDTIALVENVATIGRPLTLLTAFAAGVQCGTKVSVRKSSRLPQVYRTIWRSDINIVDIGAGDDLGSK